MTWLLDANVLIALINVSHVHHGRARHWFSNARPEFATCPITQGALVRHYFRDTTDPNATGVTDLLSVIEGMPGHTFWGDDLPYSRVLFRGVIGHRQVTDAYLAALARHHGSRLATLDTALSALHEDVAELLPD
jgi:hypothetical protein